MPGRSKQCRICVIISVCAAEWSLLVVKSAVICTCTVSRHERPTKAIARRENITTSPTKTSYRYASCCTGLLPLSFDRV